MYDVHAFVTDVIGSADLSRDRDFFVSGCCSGGEVRNSSTREHV